MEANATYPASNLQQGAQRARPALNQRPATEMESITGNLADTARRMSALADRLEGRINSFMQAPSALGSAETIQPEPQPGTIGAIKHFHRRIDEEAGRIDRALDLLAGIL